MLPSIVIENVERHIDHTMKRWDLVRDTIVDLVRKHSESMTKEYKSVAVDELVKIMGGETLDEYSSRYQFFRVMMMANGFKNLYPLLPAELREEFENFLSSFGDLTIDVTFDCQVHLRTDPLEFQMHVTSLHDVLTYCFCTKKINDLRKIASWLRDRHTEEDRFLSMAYTKNPNASHMLYSSISANDKRVRGIMAAIARAYPRDTTHYHKIPIFVRNMHEHDETYASKFVHTTYGKEEILTESKKYILFGWMFDNKDDLIQFRLSARLHDQWHELPDHLEKE